MDQGEVTVSFRAKRHAATLALLLLFAALWAVPSTLAGPVPPEQNPVSLDDEARLVVDDTVSGVVLYNLYTFGTGSNVRPKLQYNDDGTLTLYNDQDNDGPAGERDFPLVGGTFTTPFVADVQASDNAPGDASAHDYTVTDGFVTWRVTVSAAPEGATVSVVETTAGPGPLASHAASVCVATTPPELIGCLSDADRDGFSNHQEALAGSDPTDARSIPGDGMLAERRVALVTFLCARQARTTSSPCPEAPTNGDEA